MSVQTSYGFKTPVGIAGGLFDLAPYAIESRLNEEDTGLLHFGTGVVQGSTPGTNIKKPVAASTAAVFDGITINGFSTQQNMAGEIELIEGQTVGVLRYGRCWVKVTGTANPSYGKELRLVIAGDDAGSFTDAAIAENSIIAVKGRFIGGAKNGIAPVELFNQAQ